MQGYTLMTKDRRKVEYARFRGGDVEAVGFGEAGVFDLARARLIYKFLKDQGNPAIMIYDGGDKEVREVEYA